MADLDHFPSAPPLSGDLSQVNAKRIIGFECEFCSVRTRRPNAAGVPQV